MSTFAKPEKKQKEQEQKNVSYDSTKQENEKDKNNKKEKIKTKIDKIDYKNVSLEANRQEIEKIKKENQTLKDEIDTELRINNSTGQGSQAMESKITTIQDHSSNIAKLIEAESKKNRDLQVLIQVSNDVIQQSKKQLSAQGTHALPQLQQQEKQLEYNLEKIRGRHNESLAQINMLKEDVNMTRRERVIFSNVFKKLESDIKLKDEEFKKYLIKRMQIEAEKKQVEEELKKIKQRANKEMSNFKKDYDSTVKEIENNVSKSQIKNKETFQASKDVDLEQQSQVIPISIINFEESPKQQKTFSDDQRDKSPKTRKNQQDIRQSRSNNTVVVKGNQESVEQYEFMFKKLSKETGIDDIDDLINLFNNIENQNNEFFKKANEKSDEIVELRQQIEKNEKEIQKYKASQVSNQDQEQTIDKKQTVRKDDHFSLPSTEEISKIKKNIELTNVKNNKIKEDLNNINTKLQQIGDLIKLPIPSEGLNDTNSEQYLKQIEEKIDRIISMNDFCQEKVINVEKNIQLDNSITDAESKQDEQNIIDLLQNMKKIKESEKIYSQNEFQEHSKEELKNYKLKGQAKKEGGKVAKNSNKN